MQEGEHERGCGARKVGATYLIGGGSFDSCDRLPYALLTCKACGHGVHLPRTPQEIVPADFFKDHEPLEDCRCWQEKQYACPMCMPDNEPGYLMTVGANNYTPESFLEEAHKMGISKRIHQIPRHLVLGETVIYLGHPDACGTGVPGVFATFVPQRVEQLVWESEVEKKREELEKKGITIVPVKDGDADHMQAKPGAKHYHVTTSGPDGEGMSWGTAWSTQALARDALKALIANLREEGHHFSGTMAEGYQEITAEANGMRYEIIKCIDASHLEQE